MGSVAWTAYATSPGILVRVLLGIIEFLSSGLTINMFCRKASRTLENLQAGDIELTPEEVKAVDDIIVANPVVGDRYFGQSDEEAHLWA